MILNVGFMERLRLIALIEPHYPNGEGCRLACPMAILRVHLMQNWFGYSDPAMEEALYETTIFRQFSGVSLERSPNETTILSFRRLLEKRMRSMNPTYPVVGQRSTMICAASSSTAVTLRTLRPMRRAATAPVLGAATYRALGR